MTKDIPRFPVFTQSFKDYFKREPLYQGNSECSWGSRKQCLELILIALFSFCKSPYSAISKGITEKNLKGDPVMWYKNSIWWRVIDVTLTVLLGPVFSCIMLVRALVALILYPGIILSESGDPFKGRSPPIAIVTLTPKGIYLTPRTRLDGSSPARGVLHPIVRRKPSCAKRLIFG